MFFKGKLFNMTDNAKGNPLTWFSTKALGIILWRRVVRSVIIKHSSEQNRVCTNCRTELGVS